MRKKRIYLREGDEYTGPFCRRGDAERFLSLMEMLGWDSAGIEIVERDSTALPNCIVKAGRRNGCDSPGKCSVRKAGILKRSKGKDNGL